MKTAGIILLIVGLVMTVYSGYTYVTKEMIEEMGKLGITRDGEHTVHWQPFIGIGVMVIGGTVLILGKKRLATT